MSQTYEPLDLISAASLGAYNTIEDILKNNLANVNGVNEAGWTALMYAANYGHFNIIGLLAHYQCDVNYQDSQGRTALMLAASNGHTRSIEALINTGKVNKDLKDYYGLDAMNYAKNNGHGNNKLIKNMLSKASDHQSRGYQVRGRPFTFLSPSKVVPFKPRAQKPPKVMTTHKISSEEHNHIYNPCEPTVFSNSLSKRSDIWRPIKCQKLDDRNESPTRNSLAFNSSGSTLCSSMSSFSSSHSSTTSIPPTLECNKSSEMLVEGPMPKSLFHLLTRIELIEYLDVFENNSINFYQFLTLTDEDFLGLGITNFGHRKKLSIAQKRYHESLDINSTQESFLADYLLNERMFLNEKIKALEQEIKNINSFQKY